MKYLISTCYLTEFTEWFEGSGAERFSRHVCHTLQVLYYSINNWCYYFTCISMCLWLESIYYLLYWSDWLIFYCDECNHESIDDDIAIDGLSEWYDNLFLYFSICLTENVLPRGLVNRTRLVYRWYITRPCSTDHRWSPS